jgi:hypothetical protein
MMLRHDMMFRLRENALHKAYVSFVAIVRSARERQCQRWSYWGYFQAAPNGGGAAVGPSFARLPRPR